MKKILMLLSALLLGSACGVAQTTSVTATVVDSDSTVWANAPWSVSFQVGPNQSNPALYTIGGAALDPAVTQQSGAANGSGVISFSVYRSTSVSPIGSSWNLTVCPNASARCASFNFSTSGSSLNLSSQINAGITAPRFQAVAGSFGYIDGEAILALKPGSTYWNVTSNVSRCYTGSAWGDCSTGGAAAPSVTISTSSPVTVTTPGYYLNNSAGAATFTLKTLVSGDVGNAWCFRNYTTRTGAITLTAPASTFIDVLGMNGTAAGTLVSAGAAGDSVCVVAVTTTQYMAYVGAGTWTNN